jgi:hypothetical protein
MVQELVRKWVRLTPILLVAVLAVSCQKTVRQPVTVTPAQQAAPAAAPQPAAPTAAAPSSTKPPAPIDTDQDPHPGPITLAPQNPTPTAAPQVSNAPASTLLANGAGSRILPEDFKIGALGDITGSLKDQQGAMKSAELFLDSLVAGKLDSRLLAPEARGTVGDTLSWGLAHGERPTSFRISAPRTHDDGEITAAVRIFAGTGATEGEIYMTHAGDQWLVSDVQVSLAGLSVKREPPKEKFFPSAYRWLLED